MSAVVVGGVLVIMSQCGDLSGADDLAAIGTGDNGLTCLCAGCIGGRGSGVCVSAGCNFLLIQVHIDVAAAGTNGAEYTSAIVAGGAYIVTESHVAAVGLQGKAVIGGAIASGPGSSRTAQSQSGGAGFAVQVAAGVGFGGKAVCIAVDRPDIL